jgi:RNA polymerase sigma-70 factor, ECF subfamily
MTDDIDAWFDRYFKPLVHYVIGRFGVTSAEAQDIAQEAFLRTWENRANIRGAVWPYLKTTAHHLAANLERRSQARMRAGVHVPLELGAETRDEYPLPDEALLRREENARIAQALSQLTNKTREVVLRRARGESFNGIAKTLDIKPEAARQRHSGAVRRLRQMLGDIRVGIDWLEILGADDDPKG